jgi:hypothetical protein
VRGAIELRDLRAKPGQVKHAIDPGEDMVVGNQIAERPTHEELKLSSLPPSQHTDTPPCLPELRESAQQEEGNPFFNSAAMQRCSSQAFRAARSGKSGISCRIRWRASCTFFSTCPFSHPAAGLQNSGSKT